MAQKTCARCQKALRNDAFGSLCEDCYVDCTCGYGHARPQPKQPKVDDGKSTGETRRLDVPPGED